MYFLLSGEGATDLGTGLNAGGISMGDQFLPGPLALIIASVIEHHLGYSLREFVDCWGLAPKTMLMNHPWRPERYVGKKRGKETAAYYRNARALARIAKARREELPDEDEIVVIFFRDSDGTCSIDRDDWASKRESMLEGFADEGFATGVPMIPKPKSEAWLLCALHHHAHGCEQLEARPGNDRSPNALKDELSERLSAIKRLPSRNDLLALVEDGTIDWRNIRMPSFQAFIDRLREVIRADQPDRDPPADR